jgi:hypothetical protein
MPAPSIEALREEFPFKTACADDGAEVFVLVKYSHDGGHQFIVAASEAAVSAVYRAGVERDDPRRAGVDRAVTAKEFWCGRRVSPPAIHVDRYAERSYENVILNFRLTVSDFLRTYFERFPDAVIPGVTRCPAAGDDHYDCSLGCGGTQLVYEDIHALFAVGQAPLAALTGVSMKPLGDNRANAVRPGMRHAPDPTKPLYIATYKPWHHNNGSKIDLIEDTDPEYPYAPDDDTLFYFQGEQLPIPQVCLDYEKKREEVAAAREKDWEASRARREEANEAWKRKTLNFVEAVFNLPHRE